MASDSSPQPIAASLHHQTSYWLDRLGSLVHDGLEKALAEYDVTLAQWSVLVTVYRGDARMPGDIARFINVDAGALTRLIDRLAAKNLIRRCPAPGDKRSLHLELTPEAQVLVPKLARLAEANEQAFFSALTGREDQRLRKILAKLLASRDVATPKKWRKPKPAKAEPETVSS
jgi:DNA-binding MarR family transcriptional regulator